MATSISIAIWRKPAAFGWTLTNCVKVEEQYEWLALLSRSARNWYPSIFTTTTGCMTADSPTWFAVMPGSRAGGNICGFSQIDLWRFPLQVWQDVWLLHSVALRGPVQLKHRRLEARIDFRRLTSVTLVQFTALCSVLVQYTHPRGVCILSSRLKNAFCLRPPCKGFLAVHFSYVSRNSLKVQSRQFPSIKATHFLSPQACRRWILRPRSSSFSFLSVRNDSTLNSSFK